MPGHSPLSVEVEATGTKAPIRRITDHEVEASDSETLREPAKIPFLYFNPFAETIDLDVMPYQVYKFRLYFQPYDPLPKVAIGENQRNHATAGPQIQNAIIGTHFGETCKQDSVNCETVPLFLLTNQQPSVE